MVDTKRDFWKIKELRKQPKLFRNIINKIVHEHGLILKLVLSVNAVSLNNSSFLS